MLICPLASGSKGNALYIASQNARLLVDCGISLRSLTAKLKSIDVDIASIDAVLLSHEHNDHTAGIKLLSQKHGVDVFANYETARAFVCQNNCQPSFRIFVTGETFFFQDLAIDPFPIFHDAVDPCGFTITCGAEKVGVCTDMGFASTLVIEKLRHCNVLIIEANHEPNSVHASNRSPTYKQRVLSRLGHLSNQDCAALVKELVHPELKKVFCIHLSQECNSKELVERAFFTTFGAELPFDLSICSQEEIAPSYSLNTLLV